MSAYQPGEVVDITVQGARVLGEHNGYLALSYSADCDPIRVVPTFDAVTVTRVAPPEWPPRPGDLWGSGPRRWFAVEHGDTETGESGVFLIPTSVDESCKFNSRWYEPDYVNQHDGPLTLIYREPEAGEQP